LILDRAGEINRRHWREWEATVRAFNVPQLVALVKGLTVAEKTFSWVGGSVASSIWVFGILHRSADELTARETASWVVAHTANPYSPFGTMRHTRFDQWVFEHSSEYVRQQQEQRQRLESEQKDAVNQRQQRVLQRRRDHEVRCLLSKERSQQRKIDLASLESLDLQARFDVVASDWTRTLDYWPVSLTQVTNEELSELPKETVEAMMDRLRPKCPRPWRRFRTRLGQN